MINAGLAFVSSCDVPIEPRNPLTGIQAAVLRRPTMSLNERITLEEGLRMHTTNAHKMMKIDRKKRLLKGGSLADIAVFDGDLFQVPIEQLSSCKVSATIVGGQVRHKQHA
jgi:predicted amidohydrolase YtcJ